MMFNLIFMNEFNEIMGIKIKSAYLKALKEVRELVEGGYTKEMLLEWLNEKIEKEMEELYELLT